MMKRFALRKAGMQEIFGKRLTAFYPFSYAFKKSFLEIPD
jgi:hypothetical protein